MIISGRGTPPPLPEMEGVGKKKPLRTGAGQRLRNFTESSEAFAFKVLSFGVEAGKHSAFLGGDA